MCGRRRYRMSLQVLHARLAEPLQHSGADAKQRARRALRAPTTRDVEDLAGRVLVLLADPEAEFEGKVRALCSGGGAGATLRLLLHSLQPIADQAQRLAAAHHVPQLGPVNEDVHAAVCDGHDGDQRRRRRHRRGHIGWAHCPTHRELGERPRNGGAEVLAALDRVAVHDQAVARRLFHGHFGSCPKLN